MLVVRGTKKLRDRVKAAPAGAHDASTTVLGDWFATALFWRPQVALLVNQRTLLPVFTPFAPAATLLDRAPAAITSILRRHGADDSFITGELAAMAEVRLAATNDRSVVGVMNEFAFHGEHRWYGGVIDLEELSMRLAGMPLGPLRERTGYPDRELAAVLGLAQSNVVPSRGNGERRRPRTGLPRCTNSRSRCGERGHRSGDAFSSTGRRRSTRSTR